MSLDQLSHRLMTVRERVAPSSRQASAIFGSISTLPDSIAQKPDYRIGLWPCTSTSEPVIAWGLWLALSYLLEQPRNIIIYRMLARIEDDIEPDAYTWQVDQSEFGPDDWGLDALDDNIALWGTLEKAGTTWQLQIFIENDLVEGDEADEPQSLTFQGDSPGVFFHKLPEMALQLLERIDTSTQTHNFEIDDDIPDVIDELRVLSQSVFDWELGLYLSLWGREWEDEEIEKNYHALINAARQTVSNFALWLISESIQRAMLPGHSLVGDYIVPKLQELFDVDTVKSPGHRVLGRALYQSGYAERAFELLTERLESYPSNERLWRLLGALYGASGRYHEAVDAYQSAIEKDATSERLYYAYGVTLVTADQYGQDIDTFVLVDPDDYSDESVLHEAIESFKTAQVDATTQALKIEALYRQILAYLTIGYQGDELWLAFESLIHLDTNGQRTRDALDAAYDHDQDDFSNTVVALKAFTQANPDNLTGQLNLAVALIYDGQEPEGLEQLERLLSHDVHSVTMRSEIERLKLVARDTDFDHRLAEIQVMIDAGTSLTASDLELLEDAADNAPHVIDVILSLARAYLLDDDAEAALEILLDAQARQPNDATILDMLANVLWQSGQKELALQYLNTGLEGHPNDLALLLRTARYTFDEGHYESARAYMARAELIAPNDPLLSRTKAYIASKLS